MALAAAFAVAAVLAGSSGHAAPASPITVVKTPSASQIASGQQLKYTIVVTNTGGAAISNVVMTDQVNGIGVIQTPPALPQFTITSTKGSCTQGGANGNLITCNAGTMAGGESWTVTIGGQVTAGAGTTLNNTATVTGTKSSQTFTTPSNATQVLVTPGSTGGQPDLTINKTGPTSVTAGAPLTYTLTVNNIGSANATNIKAVDTLPSGVTLAATPFSTTSLFKCTSAGTPITVTCTGGAVNTGQNGTITINAIAPAAAGQITNTAVVDPDNAIAESNELNNTSAAVNTQVGGTPPQPLLSILKTDGNPLPTTGPSGWWTGAGPDPVNPGQKLTYKIFVQNNATGTNSTAGSVAIVDSTQGLDASSIVATQTIVNGSLAKTDGCVVAAPQIKCTVKTLNSGGTITVTIVGTVVQSAGSTIFNTATVTGNVKNTGVTNTASEATTVRPGVDLTITNDDTPDPVCARSWPTRANPANQHLGVDPLSPTPAASGDIPAIGLVDTPVCLGGLRYDFVIGNSGTGDASNVTVRDPLPPGTIFDSYSTDGGFTCSYDTTLNVVTCNGGSITSANAVHLSLLVVAPPAAGTITNTVTVDPNNAIFEADETNNSATQSTVVATGIDLVVWKGDNGPNSLNPHDDPPGAAPPLAEGFDPVATSGTETYTIIVDNVGTQNATGIKVVDTLPAGTRFLSAKADKNHSFTCASDNAPTGGTVTCVGGQLKGTESEFYSPVGLAPANPGIDDFATITIKVFATPNVQPAMHNEVRVDPDNTIPEANENNNLATDDTEVKVGNADKGAFNQLTILKSQTSPSGTVATNGVVTYDLKVDNLGTDPVSNVVVKDVLPAGSRFISAADTTGIGPASASFFCVHDGSATGGVITCTGGDFDGTPNAIPVGSVTRHITVKMFAPATPGDYANHATVDPDNIVPEGNEFDNDSSVPLHVGPCSNAGECTNTNAFYELTIEKTQVKPAPVGPGDNEVARNGIVTYNLKVSNLGSDPVHSVVVTDRLPAGFRFIDAKDSAGTTDVNAFTCGGPDGSGVVTCNGGSLSGTVTALGGAPTFRTIVIRMFAPDEPGTYTNNAFVDPNNTIPEGNEFNNQASLDTKVLNGGPGPYIDLSLDKTGPDKAHPGDQMVYELKVSNGGEADAFNVTVRDQLPANITFVNAADEATPGDPGQFTCGPPVGSQLDCTGGTVKAGGSRTIRVLLLAPRKIDQFATNLDAVTLGITNQAIVDPNNAIPEGDETNNADSQDTSITPSLNLKVTKDGPTTASQNDVTDYTITVTNEDKDGTKATAFGVHVVDPLPVGLIPLGVSAEPGNLQCKVLENPVNVVDCTGDMPPGDVTIKVHVFITADNGTTLDNEACVDPEDTIAETSELDNCNHKVTSVVPAAPDLRISKSASVSTVTPGQQFDYKVNVSNVGTAATTDGSVKFTDTLPTDVTFQQATATDNFNCADNGATPDVVTCTGGDLQPGETTVATITVTVNSGVTKPFTNKAQVNAAAGETNTGNNGPVSLTISVGGSGFDLSIASIQDNPDPVNARPSELTYTIVAQNNGTDAANNAIVRVVTPQQGVTVTGVAGSNGFNCAVNSTVDPQNHTYDCTGDFPGGGSTTITAVMTVNSNAPDDLELKATVDPDNAFGESDETNNTKTETTTVSGDVCAPSTSCTDLVVSQILDNPDPVDTGDTLTYTVSVVNVGNQPTNPASVWEMHLEYFGGGTMSVTPTPGNGVTCASVFMDPNHIHCKGGTGTDDMDLGPGKGIKFTVTISGVSSGSGAVSLEAFADVFGVIPEFSEANNSLVETTAVNP